MLTGRQIDEIIRDMPTSDIERMLDAERRGIDWLVFWISTIWMAALAGGYQ